MATQIRNLGTEVPALADRYNALLRQLLRGGLIAESGAAVETGVTDDGHQHSAAKLFTFTPAAKGADNVLGSQRGDDADVDPTHIGGTITSPAIPRNLRVTFGAAWDGGDVTIYGTDQDDAEIEEVFADVPGSVVVGTKVFKTVMAVAKELTGVDADGGNTITVGTGDKIGVGADVLSAFGILAVDGTAEAVTVDATVNAFTPTTAPNGSKVFVLLANVDAGTGVGEADIDDPGHTHDEPAYGIHHLDKSEVTIASATATDLATSIALLREMVAVFNPAAAGAAYPGHIVDALAHVAADGTNVLEEDTIDDSAEDDGLADAIAVANDLKAKYNAHLAESGVHLKDDATNNVATSDATNLATLQTLANALKTKINLHLASGPTYAGMARVTPV